VLARSTLTLPSTLTLASTLPLAGRSGLCGLSLRSLVLVGLLVALLIRRVVPGGVGAFARGSGLARVLARQLVHSLTELVQAIAMRTHLCELIGQLSCISVVRDTGAHALRNRVDRAGELVLLIRDRGQLVRVRSLALSLPGLFLALTLALLRLAGQALTVRGA